MNPGPAPDATPARALGLPGPETGARLFAVAAGGAVGTALRVGAVTAVPDTWSVATIMVVNFVGAFLLGLLTGRITQPRRRQFLLVGVLGSFTTFSTFVVDGIALASRGVGPWWIAAQVFVTLVGGLWVARLGLSVNGPPPWGARS